MTILEIADKLYTACKEQGFEVYFEQARFTNSVYVIVYHNDMQFKLRVSDHNEGYLTSNFVDLRPDSIINIPMIIGSILLTH